MKETCTADCKSQVERESFRIERRTALGMMAAGMAGAPMSAFAFSGHHGGHEFTHWNTRQPILNTWPLAAQLWTVNDQLLKDLPGTLKHLKSLGYTVVETAGLLGYKAADFHLMLADAGLGCCSTHTAMGDLLDNLEQKIEDAKHLGAEWLVCASPKPPTALPAGKDWLRAMRDAMTLDSWKENADALADMVPKVQKSGLKLAYHNHFMEFVDYGGTTGYSLIVAASEELRLEMDLGWVRVGGVDPLALVNQFKGRIDLLHIKDVVVDATQPIGFRSVEVGRGMIDWKPVLEAARSAHVRYAFIEQEPPYLRDVFDSLAISRDFLKTL